MPLAWHMSLIFHDLACQVDPGEWHISTFTTFQGVISYGEWCGMPGWHINVSTCRGFIEVELEKMIDIPILIYTSAFHVVNEVSKSNSWPTMIVGHSWSGRLRWPHALTYCRIQVSHLYIFFRNCATQYVIQTCHSFRVKGIYQRRDLSKYFHFNSFTESWMFTDISR